MVKSASKNLSASLAKAYQHACLAEVEAMKPGNVHVFADGHGMEVGDFIQSADASMHPLTDPSLGLGERVYCAFDATWQAVGMNTNLGILLLCAPLIQASLQSQSGTLRDKLTTVLANSTREDAEYVFAAIRMAHPAGLGASTQHDVHRSADCTLLQAMQFAAPKDTIALQYSHAFNAVFSIGLPCYQQHLQRWQRSAWATTAMYLQWLITFNDSHVERKHGQQVADYLRNEAQQHQAAFSRQENPKQYLPKLLAFDQQLKSLGINPGTSADLTVATLLVEFLSRVLDN